MSDSNGGLDALSPGPNWYGYAEGNPLRWVDPLGLWGFGMSIDFSTIQPLTQGWGGTYGWNFQYTSDAGWGGYNYSTPNDSKSFGFLLGPSLQANLAFGNGDWTGPFESCNGSAGPFAFGTFRSPGGIGYDGFSLGFGRGPPGVGCTKTVYRPGLLPEKPKPALAQCH